MGWKVIGNCEGNIKENGWKYIGKWGWKGIGNEREIYRKMDGNIQENVREKYRKMEWKVQENVREIYRKMGWKGIGKCIENIQENGTEI